MDLDLIHNQLLDNAHDLLQKATTLDSELNMLNQRQVCSAREHHHKTLGTFLNTMSQLSQLFVTLGELKMDPGPALNRYLVLLDEWETLTGHVGQTRKRPANEMVIGSLETVIKSASLVCEQCSICQFECEDGDMLKRLPCGHWFHESCVDRWLRIKATCPLCNVEIKGMLEEPAVGRQRCYLRN